VGVNKYVQGQEEAVELLPWDAHLERRQIERVRQVRAERDDEAVRTALRRLEETARGTDNLLYPMKEALAAYATIGEVSDALRKAFGAYQAPAVI
jgi:methylmalonyl-CoA mutase N-terminal domain/subunit